MLEQGLFDYIKNKTIADGRVYPMIAPQGTTQPYITYTRISGERLQTMGGISGVENPRIQVDCWALTYYLAKQLAEEVRLLLDSYKGEMGNETILMSLNDGDKDDYERDLKTGQTYYRVMWDFEIWHEESKV